MDRQITISRNPRPFTAGGWVNQNLSWREFAAGLSSPLTGAETFEEYLKAGKKDKTNIKSSVGGYVGGPLDGSGLRRRHHMAGRDMVTLDFDHLAPGDDKVIQSMCSLLGCDYVMHSSQSHTTSAPRIRVLIPLSRTIENSNEFAAVSRRLAFRIDPTMSKLDKTSHEYERLMFYPRHSKDAPYVFVWGGQNRQNTPLCDVDALLAEYMDWRNTEEWPKAPDNDYPIMMPDEKKLKREPSERAEPIGSFCAFFSMTETIASFLSDVYEHVDGDRYTYLGGTSAAGAIVYDDKFMFSHHDTDPAGGKTLNAFELVQLHRFGDLDEAANADKDIGLWSDKQSFTAMCEWVQSNQHPALMRYRLEVVREKGKKFSDIMDNLLPRDAESDFAGVAASGDEIQWGEGELNKDGTVKPTLASLQKIVSRDPLLIGRIKHDVIGDKIVLHGTMPWHIGDLKEPDSEDDGWREWDADADLTGLRAYCEEKYGIPGTKKALVEDAVKFVAKTGQRNSVVEYITGCEWDGTPRVDTLFIDYLGAADNPATREATHKALLGCVHRAMEPGCKFDAMCVLIGPQGVGKSTILNRLAVKEAWFTDSIYSFDGKSLAESIKGCWIVEIGELHALRKAEIGQVRQVIASKYDKQRLAYEEAGKKQKPRRCVFFGTGNDPEVVRDPKGERRFWLIETSVQPCVKNVWNDLTPDEVRQIWAEAYTYYCMGESDVLSPETYDALLERQTDFRDDDPWEASIRQFVLAKVPSDWARWSIMKRLEFWDRFNADALRETETDDYSCMTGIDGQPVGELVERDRVSAREIWCERLSGSNAYTRDSTGDRLGKQDKKRINTALRAIMPVENERCLSARNGDMIPGKWKYMAIRNGYYGSEKGFKRQD